MSTAFRTSFLLHYFIGSNRLTRLPVDKKCVLMTNGSCCLLPKSEFWNNWCHTFLFFVAHLYLHISNITNASHRTEDHKVDRRPKLTLLQLIHIIWDCYNRVFQKLTENENQDKACPANIRLTNVYSTCVHFLFNLLLPHQTGVCLGHYTVTHSCETWFQTEALGWGGVRHPLQCRSPFAVINCLHAGTDASLWGARQTWFNLI